MKSFIHFYLVVPLYFYNKIEITKKYIGLKKNSKKYSSFNFI